MDNYLESLVVKGEKTEEVAPQEEVKEEDVVAEIEEAVAEPAEEAVEEPVEEVAEPAEETAPAEVVEEPVVEAEPEEKKVATVTITAEDTNNGLVHKNADVATVAPEEPTAVVDIRIFNTPDPKGPFKIFSGNVIVKQRIDTMTQIEYMKPGFGLVKGFTPDLK